MSSSSLPTLTKAASARAPLAFVPCLRVRTERLVIEGDTPAGWAEVETPVLALSFDYGGVRIRSADRRRSLAFERPGGLFEIVRDEESERQARFLLEGLGAVEISCVSDMSTLPGSDEVLLGKQCDLHDAHRHVFLERTTITAVSSCRRE